MCTIGTRYARAPAESTPNDLVVAAPVQPASPTRGNHLQTSVTRSPIRFSEMGNRFGIDAPHVSGIDGEKMFPTANGSGVALIDFNGDAALDLYTLSFQSFSATRSGDPPAVRNQIYRATPRGGLESLAGLTGLDFADFCQGVTAGDIDNDGFPEIYVTTYGRNRLFRNQGDGTFRDVSALSGADSEQWGTSAAFLDFDDDGDLDLYVANYGKWSPEENLWCGDRVKNVRIFCRPTYITPVPHQLFRNDGAFSFQDVAQEVGVHRGDGRGQGVVAADVNQDGLIDLYVANDMCPNYLFLNQNGRFNDFSESSGAAYNNSGAALAGMGVDATDLNHDGLPELFVTNFYNEYNNLYLNLGKGFFEDISSSSGLGPDSLLAVGWGTMLADLDNDGLPDVLVVNGHVDDNLHMIGPEQPYQQKAEVWRNKGALRFERLSSLAGEYFSTAHVSRGAAFGDVDDDGRLDVVVAQLDEQPAVLRNESEGIAPGQTHGWIRLQLIGRSCNRDAVGAEIVVETGKAKLYRQIKGGGSYLSAHDLRVLVGVGQEQIQRVGIRWPGRVTSELVSVEPGSHRVIQP